jgi:hypothetical protein
MNYGRGYGVRVEQRDHGDSLRTQAKHKNISYIPLKFQAEQKQVSNQNADLDSMYRYHHQVYVGWTQL